MDLGEASASHLLAVRPLRRLFVSAAGGSWASRSACLDPLGGGTPERAEACTGRGGCRRLTPRRQPGAGRVRARGVAGRRPLVDGGATRPPLLRGRARVGTERVRLPRPRAWLLVHAAGSLKNAAMKKRIAAFSRHSMLAAALRADPEAGNLRFEPARRWRSSSPSAGRSYCDERAYRSNLRPMLATALRADPEAGNLRFEPAPRPVTGFCLLATMYGWCPASAGRRGYPRLSSSASGGTP